MKQITLSIPDREYTFFMKVIKAFGFVKIEKTKTVKIVNDVLYLLSVYDKSEKESLDEKELDLLIKMAGI
jgi:Tfp pilus assembly protein PilZ